MTIPFAGNALKAKVVADLFASKVPLTVLDYGAGDGAGWMAAPPNGPVRLIAYEPSEASYAAIHPAPSPAP